MMALGCTQLSLGDTIGVATPGRVTAVLDALVDAGIALDSIAATTPGVFLYHPGKRQILPKLRAFIDHLKSAA